MLIAVHVNEALLNNALEAARAVGKEAPLAEGLLSAPLGNEANSWVTTIWDTVEAALKRAYREGKGAAQQFIDKATSQLQQLADEAAELLHEVRTVLMEKLHAYLQAAIDGALQRVRPFVAVGGAVLKLRTVKVEQKITLSGSLRASLEEICEFVAEGEITLATEYGEAGSE